MQSRGEEGRVLPRTDFDQWKLCCRVRADLLLRHRIRTEKTLFQKVHDWHYIVREVWKMVDSVELRLSVKARGWCPGLK